MKSKSQGTSKAGEKKTHHVYAIIGSTDVKSSIAIEAMNSFQSCLDNGYVIISSHATSNAVHYIIKKDIS